MCIERINIRGINSGRIDDNLDSLKKRFDVFFIETIENYKHLEKITKVLKIKADLGKNEVFENIIKELDVVLR
jgi:UMP-CMP kinase